MEFKPTTDNSDITRLELAFALAYDGIIKKNTTEERADEFNKAYIKIIACTGNM